MHGQNHFTLLFLAFTGQINLVATKVQGLNVGKAAAVYME
jgi:hypothetical protein